MTLHEIVTDRRVRALGPPLRLTVWPVNTRDGWILLQSASPKGAAIWFADKLDAMDDPEFVAIYLEYDAAFDWPADDPRLEALADRSERWFVRRGGEVTRGKQPAADPGIAKLIATSTGSSSPAWDRLKEIAKERMAGG